MQAPLHAVEQQARSTQNPEAHSSSFSHVAPFIFGPQLPATHWRPLTQSLFWMHAEKQSWRVVSHE
jgi:hypothetical protein